MKPVGAQFTDLGFLLVVIFAAPQEVSSATATKPPIAKSVYVALFDLL